MMASRLLVEAEMFFGHGVDPVQAAAAQAGGVGGAHNIRRRLEVFFVDGLTDVTCRNEITKTHYIMVIHFSALLFLVCLWLESRNDVYSDL